MLNFENLYSPDKVHPVANNENKNNIKITNLTKNNNFRDTWTILFIRNATNAVQYIKYNELKYNTANKILGRELKVR